MAGDWIKLEHATPDKHEIRVLSRLLGISKGDAFYLVVKWWIWLDTHTSDGALGENLSRKCNAPSVTKVTQDVTQMYAQDVDETVHAAGFAMALAAVGWLEVGVDGRVLAAPNFERHNGKTAKSRALSSRRQGKFRDRDEEISSRKSNAESVTKVTLRALPEKRREESKNTPSSAALDEGFAEFWVAYPRHVDKKDALQAWRRLKPDEGLRRKIVAAVMASREGQWRETEGRFIPYPSRYLNARRWEDEQQPPPIAEQRTWQ